MRARKSTLLLVLGPALACGEHVTVPPAEAGGATSSTADVASSPSSSASTTGGVGGMGGFGGAGPSGGGGQGAGGAVGEGVTSWSKRFGGPGIDSIGTPSIDPVTGDYVLAGIFDTSIDFGVGPMTTNGDLDTWLAELDAAGNAISSTSFFATGGTEYVGPWAITRDALGATTVIGIFQQQVDFGGGLLVSAGAYDFFVARLDAAGEHLWSNNFGDASDQCA